MRSRLLAAALLAAPAILRAQSGAPAPAMPAGWQMHLDRATLPADYTFGKAGTGFHATTVRAAGTFYDPKLTASGSYRVDATFTQTKAPMHPEAYGVIFGGSALESDTQQSYFYFVVRGDGKFLINHRAGTEVHKLIDWTASPAVHVADASGKATNALHVDVRPDSVRFSVNGTRVAALADLGANGIVGLRINHGLDVQVEGPKITK